MSPISTPSSKGSQSPRGWGLFLIKNMVDEAARVRSDGRHHTLELILRLRGEDDGQNT